MSRDDIGRKVRRPRTLERPKVGVGPLGELKDLLYHLYMGAGAPTLDDMALHIEQLADELDWNAVPARDTIRRCIASPDLPPGQHDVVAIARSLARKACWDEGDAATRARDLWVKAHMHRPPGRPISQLSDPFELEVHRAIAPLAGGEDLPTLPVYVEREHDVELAEVASRAASGISGLAVLVGDSSTGKTRACWEVINKLPQGWRLWHPIFPGHAEALLDGVDRVAPHTVIWLNDIQHYLLTPPGDLGPQVAAALRDLLREGKVGPVLVLGTIWRHEWSQLTSSPVQAGMDPHAQARSLLRGSDIEIPESFSAADMVQLRAKAGDDSRLRQALQRAECGMIAQYLAGAPVILERYRHALPGAKALMEAAMDARRLGLGKAIPEELLEAAAPGYLGDPQWDALSEDWLDEALAYATAPCLGAPGPLTRIRPRPDAVAPQRPHYRLADYLEQLGREKRVTASGPKCLWDALVLYAPHSDRQALADEAAERFFYEPALKLYADAVDSGNAAITRRVADLLKEVGLREAAIEHYVVAAHQGDLQSIQNVADWLRQAGAEDMSAHFLEIGVELGDEISQWVRAEELLAKDETEAAIPYLTMAMTGEYTPAFRKLADIMAEQEGIPNAADWVKRQAREGGVSFFREAGEWLRENGLPDDARVFYREAIRAQSEVKISWLIHFLSESDEESRIDDLIHHIVTSDSDEKHPETEWLVRQGLVERALEWLRKWADSGAAEAAKTLSHTLRRLGRHEEGFAYYRHLLDGDDTNMLRHAAQWLKEMGRVDEAYELDRRAAEGGHPDAMSGVAHWLEMQGRYPEALMEYQRAVHAIGRAKGSRHLSLWAISAILERGVGMKGTVKSDVPDPLEKAVELLTRDQGVPTAAEWLLERAEAGNPVALKRAIELFMSQGMEERAQRLRRYGIEPGGRIASAWEPPSHGSEAVE
ncbi:hypothetical protein ACFCVY_13995 [Streptomyces sp. NPDC056411]|uniref:tetratricopeptide repeat protein n=1 Tax=Streptomyces sp. NPDC056411 TaxID=3345813 RepID=UPI0035E0B7A9